MYWKLILCLFLAKTLQNCKCYRVSESKIKNHKERTMSFPFRILSQFSRLTTLIRNLSTKGFNCYTKDGIVAQKVLSTFVRTFENLNSNGSFDRRMRLVIQNFKIVVLITKNCFGLTFEYSIEVMRTASVPIVAWLAQYDLNTDGHLPRPHKFARQ